jgi:hypothetical protein
MVNRSRVFEGILQTFQNASIRGTDPDSRLDWFPETAQGLYHIRHFPEPKTTWHPVGA